MLKFIAPLILCASLFGQASFSALSPTTGVFAPQIMAFKAFGEVIGDPTTLHFSITFTPTGGSPVEKDFMNTCYPVYLGGSTWSWRGSFVFQAAVEGIATVKVYTTSGTPDDTHPVTVEL